MCWRIIGKRMSPSVPTRTVRVNSGASYTVMPIRSSLPIFSTGRLEPSLKEVAPPPTWLGFACCCAETELATAIARSEMVKHLINDSRTPAWASCPSPWILLLEPDRTSAISSLVAASFERCDFRCKLLNLFVQASHLSVKLDRVNAEPIFRIHPIQEHAHGVAREVRHASRTGH